MKRFLRLVRGMVGMGATFAVALTGVATVYSVVKWLVFGADLRYELIETVLTAAAPIGFLMGVSFAGLVALHGRNQTFREMSAARFAAWGALGGILLYSLFGDPFSRSSLLDDLVNGGFWAALSAGCGIGVHRFARSQPDSDKIQATDGRPALTDE